MRRTLALVTSLIVCGACSEPPTSVDEKVSRVEVAPGSLAMFVGETVQLTATARDEGGDVITGAAVTWSSGNPGVAKVTPDGRVTAVGTGTARITATAGGKSGEANVVGGPRIGLESGRGTTAVIGVEGGTLSTSSASGVDYALTIPPGAVMAPVSITMTPISAVAKFPLSGGFGGGVDLQPSGLVLAVPAELRIEIGQRPSGTGLRLFALSYEGTGSLLLPDLVKDLGTEARLHISHFSGGAVGFGTIIDIEALLGLPDVLQSFDSAQSAPYRAQLVPILFGPPPVDTAAAEQAFADWFRNVVLPRAAAASDDPDLFEAVSVYLTWYVVSQFFADHDLRFGTQQLSFIATIAPKLRAAILGNIATCRASASIGALANAVFWMDQATVVNAYGTQGFNYDSLQMTTDMLQNDCAAIVLEQVNLPNILDVGTQYTMGLDFAVDLGAAKVRTNLPFKVVLAPLSTTNVNIQLPDGFTDSAGFFPREVTATAAGAVDIIAVACPVLPGRTVHTELACDSELIQRQATDPQQPPPPTSCADTLAPPNGLTQIFSVASFNAAAKFRVIVGNVSVHTIDSLPNVDFPCLEIVTGGFGITNPKMQSISFPRLAEVGFTLNLVQNAVLTTASFPALSSVGARSQFGGGLGIADNPALSSLTIGAVTIHTVGPVQGGGLQLFQPLALQDLSGLSTAISVDTLFYTLPAAGQPGLTESHFQAYKLSAPGVKAVCQRISSSQRKCL